jgi:hypothetical protein
MKTIEELEADGESEVRRKLAMGAYEPRDVPFVLGWLRQKDARRAEAAQQRVETAQQEDQRRASEANAIAAGGNRVAFYSVIVAAITAVIAVYFTG